MPGASARLDHAPTPFGRSAAAAGPVFASEDPRWPELPEALDPVETEVHIAAGRFPREEPERWNALPF